VPELKIWERPPSTLRNIDGGKIREHPPSTLRNVDGGASGGARAEDPGALTLNDKKRRQRALRRCWS
jgi:hypothetical protein